MLTYFTILLLLSKLASFSAGLILVPPPIWVILCSFRTVVTTFIYKFILKRDVTTLQFVGSFLIVLSIVVAKLGISRQS